MSTTKRVINACVPLSKEVANSKELAELPPETLKKIVDTHIYRPEVRLGVIQAETKDKAADELTLLTAPCLRLRAHEWLIQHGMNACRSRSPLCQEYCISVHCLDRQS